MKWFKYSGIIIVLIFLWANNVLAQPGTDLKLDKPDEYKNRVLASEKSNTKKFPVFKRFIQNTVTRYNYFFNANNKLNEVIERAKLAHKDDYSKLISFYNYSLSSTARDSLELDSVISKSQSGIALHDLRNDWIDNLYLLWGAAYHLQQKFDSSYLLFQYINTSFAERNDNGSYKTIGSRRDGGGDLSISTKEKGGILRKTFSRPPSRNETFIWQIKNSLEQEKYTQAASLIIALKEDPDFPKRMYPDLAEMQAYYFYKQQRWDSAAIYLEQALGNASNKNEQARWEYLLAQLYELSGHTDQAEKYYAKASVHTTDLILDIYARLFKVKVNREEGDNAIKKNIEQLLKMAKRDKYEDYRDIIYYMAAQMQLELNNIDAALALLAKSTQYPTNDPLHRNRAFLQLAELHYSKKQYREAYNFYDSVQLNQPGIDNPEAIESLKKSLAKIANSLQVIDRQDSLQRIAALPENERIDYVKKLVRQLRKKQGLKDESAVTAGSSSGNSEDGLFQNNNARGEWYFYNANSKSKGLTAFTAKWGNRPNTDNWRRSAAAQTAINTNMADATRVNNSSNTKAIDSELTFDAFYNRLPLAEELMKESNDSIQQSLFVLGKTYIQEIEECEDGVTTLESLRTEFPTFEPMDEVLFSLYYCYNKNGETAKAAAIKATMGQSYAKSNFTTIVATGKNPENTLHSPEATKAYEQVYDLFIEGNFAKAVEEKKKADAQYQGSAWTPQLLYIESVYYIQERADSTAIKTLQQIVDKFPEDSLMADKAENLISVLKRRKEIEEELTNLHIVRPAEEPRSTAAEYFVKEAEVVTQPVTITEKAPSPIVAPTKATEKPTEVKGSYTFNPLTPHYVVLILNKVDRVFVNEARNAFARYNNSTYSGRKMQADLTEIDEENKLLLISPFTTMADAINYIEKTKPITPTRIIPWLKGGKYSFSVLSEHNLEFLKTTKNIADYQSFLESHIPNVFNE